MVVSLVVVLLIKIIQSKDKDRPNNKKTYLSNILRLVPFAPSDPHRLPLGPSVIASQHHFETCNTVSSDNYALILSYH
eukprot:4833021-Amphidinium_carterae.1